MRASHGLKWENKMYKLKRSIGYQALKFRDDNGGLENWPCAQCYSFYHLYFTFQAELT